MVTADGSAGTVTVIAWPRARQPSNKGGRMALGEILLLPSAWGADGLDVDALQG